MSGPPCFFLTVLNTSKFMGVFIKELRSGLNVMIFEHYKSLGIINDPLVFGLYTNSLTDPSHSIMSRED